MASARRQALRARETGPDEPAERTGRANRPSEVANPTPDAVNDSFMSWNAVNDSFTASPPDVTAARDPESRGGGPQPRERYFVGEGDAGGAEGTGA
jgi:hypothetical protein